MTEHATLTPCTHPLVLLYEPIKIEKLIGFNHANLAAGKYRNKHQEIDYEKAIFHHQITLKILDLLFLRNYKSLEGETTENNLNQPTSGFEYK